MPMRLLDMDRAHRLGTVLLTVLAIVLLRAHRSRMAQDLLTGRVRSRRLTALVPDHRYLPPRRKMALDQDLARWRPLPAVAIRIRIPPARLSRTAVAQDPDQDLSVPQSLLAAVNDLIVSKKDEAARLLHLFYTFFLLASSPASRNHNPKPIK